MNTETKHHNDVDPDMTQVRRMNAVIAAFELIAAQGAASIEKPKEEPKEPTTNDK